jgi:flagellar biosynthesis protein FliR
MSIKFDEAWMLATVLLWVRLGALFFMSPFVSAAKVPAVVVMVFTLVLAGLFTLAFELRAAQSVDQMVPLALAVLSELLTGALMGFALQCAFAAFSMGGQLLDLQMGFGMGSIFDPVTRANTPVLGTVFALFAVAFFFAVDGHHAFVRGIAYSIRAVPPGTAGWGASLADLMRPVGAMFTTAVAVIAPVLFMLLLVEIVLMMVSRVLPQMNVFFVGIPAKILIGLALLAATSAWVGPVMVRAYAGIFRFWEAVLR